MKVIEFCYIKRGETIVSGNKHCIRYFFPEPKEVYSNVFYSQKLIKINDTIPRKYSLKVPLQKGNTALVIITKRRIYCLE